jgi:hypothetical protein
LKLGALDDGSSRPEVVAMLAMKWSCLMSLIERLICQEHGYLEILQGHLSALEKLRNVSTADLKHRIGVAEARIRALRRGAEFAY